MATFSGNRLEQGIRTCGYSAVVGDKLGDPGRPDFQHFVKGFANPKMLINGVLVTSQGSEVFEDRSPITGLILVDNIAKASTADADAAVAAARACFDSAVWQSTPEEHRALKLMKLLELIKAKADDLAHLAACDTGVPLKNCRTDVEKAIQLLEYYCTSFVGNLMTGNCSLRSAQSKDVSFVYRHSVGVVIALLSWKNPLSVLMMAMCPCLLTGNTMVIKACTSAPLVCLKVAEMTTCCDFPAGAVNFITGPGYVIGAHLLRHRGINKVVFYGQRTIANGVQALCTQSGHQLNTDFVGKATACLLPDCDLPSTLEAIKKSAFQSFSAQSVVIDKILVHSSLYEAVRTGLVAMVSSLKLGDTFDSVTDIGPSCSRQSFHKTIMCIERCLEDGASLASGGCVQSSKGSPTDFHGVFVQPAVLVGCLPSCEELVGPVVSLHSYEDHEEMLRLANEVNSSKYLVVFSRDIFNQAITQMPKLYALSNAEVIVMNTVDVSLGHQAINVDRLLEFYTVKKEFTICNVVA